MNADASYERAAGTLPLIRPFELTRDPWGRLVLADSDGKRHENVRPVRAFPISDPGHWISICSARGDELVCIDDPDKLSSSVRELLEEDLAGRTFIPRIVRIDEITPVTEGTEWEVGTDRGDTTFHLESEDDLRLLHDERILLIDSSGVRYMIPDVRRLDAASRRRLERYL